MRSKSKPRWSRPARNMGEQWRRLGACDAWREHVQFPNDDEGLLASLEAAAKCHSGWILFQMLTNAELSAVRGALGAVGVFSTDRWERILLNYLNFDGVGWFRKRITMAERKAARR